MSGAVHLLGSVLLLMFVVGLWTTAGLAVIGSLMAAITLAGPLVFVAVFVCIVTALGR